VFLVLVCRVQSSAAVDTKKRPSKPGPTSKYLCQFSKIILQGSRTSSLKMKAILSSETYANSYRGADKSSARPTSRCILFDGENISFDASLVIYTNCNNIPSIMIINRIYENQNLLSL
jgi:hypothetical protein